MSQSEVTSKDKCSDAQRLDDSALPPNCLRCSQTQANGLPQCGIPLMSNSLLLATVHLLSEQKTHMVYRMLCDGDIHRPEEFQICRCHLASLRAGRECKQEVVTPVGTRKGTKSSLISGDRIKNKAFIELDA